MKDPEASAAPHQPTFSPSHTPKQHKTGHIARCKPPDEVIYSVAQPNSSIPNLYCISLIIKRRPTWQPPGDSAPPSGSLAATVASQGWW